MGRVRSASLLAVCALVIFLSSGCTFYMCSGGGPLRYDELGDWLGIAELERPPASELRDLRERTDWGTWKICGGTFKLPGDYWGFSLGIPGDTHKYPFTPVPGFELRGRFPLCKRLIPSKRKGLHIYLPQGDGREFYATESEWGPGLMLGDFIAAGDTANAYDAATHERVAAQKTSIAFGLGLLYTRCRSILPVDERGREGLQVIKDRSISPRRTPYKLKDGSISLFGMLGWGRVNRKRYIQILWIPIPIGELDL